MADGLLIWFGVVARMIIGLVWWCGGLQVWFRCVWGLCFCGVGAFRIGLVVWGTMVWLCGPLCGKYGLVVLGTMVWWCGGLWFDCVGDYGLVLWGL